MSRLDDLNSKELQKHRHDFVAIAEKSADLARRLNMGIYSNFIQGVGEVNSETNNLINRMFIHFKILVPSIK